MADNAWTYADVVGFVGEFLCGVAEANTQVTDLNGATFTVHLRLTNPETQEYFNVNTVTYTFGATAADGIIDIQ